MEKKGIKNYKPIERPLCIHEFFLEALDAQDKKSMKRFSKVEEKLLGGVDINQPDNDGNTLLHLAAQKADGVAIEFLLKFPKIKINPLNYSRRYPIDYLATGKKTNLSAIRILIQHGAMDCDPKDIQLYVKLQMTINDAKYPDPSRYDTFRQAIADRLNKKLGKKG